VFRVIVPADDQLSTNENDSENIESADEEEEQEDDGNEMGEEVVDDNNGEEDEDAEDGATEAEAETEDGGDQYVVAVLSFLLLIIFFVLGSRTRCIWRILKKLFRTFEFLAIVSFNVLLFIKISIPTLKKCGVYQADLVDTYLKKTYKGLPFLPK